LSSCEFQWQVYAVFTFWVAQRFQRCEKLFPKEKASAAEVLFSTPLSKKGAPKGALKLLGLWL